MEADRLGDKLGLLRQESLLNGLNLCMLSENGQDIGNIEKHELQALNENDYLWIAFTKTAERGLILEPVTLAELARLGRERGVEAIAQVSQRLTDTSNVSEAIEHYLREERKKLLESICETCRAVHGSIDFSQPVLEYWLRDQLRAAHEQKGVGFDEKHYNDSMNRFREARLELKTYGIVPPGDITRIISGELRGNYILTMETFEAAAEKYETPEELLEAARKRAFIIQPEGDLIIDKGEQVEQVQQLLIKNVSVVLVEKEGKGEASAIGKRAINAVRTKYLWARLEKDPSKPGFGLASLLTDVYKQASVPAKSSSGGRPSLEDLRSRQNLSKLVERGYRLLLVEDIGRLDSENVTKFVTGCFQAGITLVLTSERKIEIPGLTNIEVGECDSSALAWMAAFHWLRQGVVPEFGAVVKLAALAEKENGVKTIIELVDKLKSGTSIELDEFFKERERQRVQRIMDSMDNAEKAVHDYVVNLDGKLMRNEVETSFQQARVRNNSPPSSEKFTEFLAKMLELGYVFPATERRIEPPPDEDEVEEVEEKPSDEKTRKGGWFDE